MCCILHRSRLYDYFLSYLTPFIPILISLLSFERSFEPASETLQEVMTSSSLSDGSGSKTLTEPLLEYFAANGQAIYEQAAASTLWRCGVDWQLKLTF